MKCPIFCFLLFFIFSIANAGPLAEYKIKVSIDKSGANYKWVCILDQEAKKCTVKEIAAVKFVSFNQVAKPNVALRLLISSKRMENYAQWDTGTYTAKSMFFYLDTVVLFIKLSKAGTLSCTGGDINRGMDFLMNYLEEIPSKYFRGDKEAIKLVGEGNEPGFWRHNQYKEFVKKNPKNLASYMAIGFMMANPAPLDDIQDIKAIYYGIDSSMINNEAREYYRNVIVDREKEVADRQAIAYKSFDLLNESLNVTSMGSQSKLLLIDMWASWCGPCRQMTPLLKKMKEKYNSQLDLLSISIDKDENRWLKANNEEQFGWPSFLIPKTDSSFINHYKVIGVPTLILFDKAGNSLKRITGLWFFSDLEKILDDYLVANPD